MERNKRLKNAFKGMLFSLVIIMSAIVTISFLVWQLPDKRLFLIAMRMLIICLIAIGILEYKKEL